MISAIKRMFDVKALIVTTLFSAIYHGVAAYLFVSNGVAYSDPWSQAVGLVGFAIAGVIYALFAVSRLPDLYALDLIGVGVWIVVATAVGSLTSVTFVQSAELTQWTTSGIQGELLAVVAGFVTLFAHEPSLLRRRQDV